MEPIEVVIPFSGFYGSLHDSLMNDAVQDQAAWYVAQQAGVEYNGYHDLPNTLASRAAEIVWRQNGSFRSQYRHNYAVAYARLWCSEADLEYHSFGEVSSPRYYNFSTDRIFAFVEYKSLQRLRCIHAKDFVAYALKNIHSRDGFILFSEYRPELWVRKPCRTWDALMWGMFLDWYAEHEMSDEPIYIDNAGEYLPYDLLDLTVLEETV